MECELLIFLPSFLIRLNIEVMIKVKALLDFPVKENGRTAPIICDFYRPLIKVGENAFVSGAIQSEEKTKIYPGERVYVDIYIESGHLVGEVAENQVLTFWEPPVQIGEITVKTIYN